MADDSIRLTRRRVLGGFATLAGASAATGAGTMAYFSDEETSADNTIQAGTLELTLDGSSESVTFLDESGIVPGEFGSETVDLENTGSVDGTLEVEVEDVQSYDEDGQSPGEIEDYLWVQAAADGEQAFDSPRPVSNLQAGEELLSGISVPSGTIEEFTFSWELDSNTPNGAQGNSVVLDLRFRLVQSGGG